jgi:hypothetical protein
MSMTPQRIQLMPWLEKQRLEKEKSEMVFLSGVAETLN